MPKSILTVGLHLASDAAHAETLRSKVSLLDWDIILFRPEIDDFTNYAETYQGKPALYDTSSFQLKECCEHWRREIKQAIETGKTIIVFLSAVNEVYVATGENTYSGTGRNQKKTRIVTLYSNYSALPLSLRPVNATGSAMKLTPLGATVLAPFWAEFSSVSKYKVLLPLETKEVFITTKNGDKPVGATFRSKNFLGSLVLLPDIDFLPDNFIGSKGEEKVWTRTAQQFAGRMIAAIVALDSALHSTAEATPEPDWATDAAFGLAIERSLRSELLDAERQVEGAQRRKEDVLERLAGAGRLRALLYEKGKLLENAIIEALSLLGFKASPYKEANSEFDVVFTCEEGRFLGEAEGKDNKAVNVDKLRQLAMNVHEDLQRETVNSPAKPVLFGNGFRLSPPGQRAVQFTEKCITASRLESTALVATADLYRAAQYLSDQVDTAYAKLCRETILAGVGVVALPSPPKGIVVGPADVSE